MDKWIIQQVIDLAEPECMVTPGVIDAYNGDYSAHEWRVTVLNAGRHADLTGYSARAYYTRSDGVRVVGSASIRDGYIISAPVPEAAYSVNGPVTAILRLYTGATAEERFTTIAMRELRVTSTVEHTTIDPDHVLYGYTELQARISALEALLQKLEVATGMRNIRLEDIENLYIQPTTPTVAEYPGLQAGDIWIKT